MNVRATGGLVPFHSSLSPTLLPFRYVCYKITLVPRVIVKREDPENEFAMKRPPNTPQMQMDCSSKVESVVWHNSQSARKSTCYYVRHVYCIELYTTAGVIQGVRNVFCEMKNTPRLFSYIFSFLMKKFQYLSLLI